SPRMSHGGKHCVEKGTQPRSDAVLPAIIGDRCQGQLQLSFREQGVVALDGPREQREAGSCHSHSSSEWLELLLCVQVQDTANW
uniref:Uncharacterized protein n=1 Tax=Nomascus leucogenys TaxID=61853 RepID=A0A2I3HZM1_NOMLE